MLSAMDPILANLPTDQSTGLYPRFGPHGYDNSCGYHREDESLIINRPHHDHIHQPRQDNPIGRTNTNGGGLSEETIVKHLRTRRCIGPDAAVCDDKKDICVICQHDLFGENEEIATLAMNIIRRLH